MGIALTPEGWVHGETGKKESDLKKCGFVVDGRGTCPFCNGKGYTEGHTAHDAEPQAHLQRAP